MCYNISKVADYIMSLTNAITEYTLYDRKQNICYKIKKYDTPIKPIYLNYSNSWFVFSQRDKNTAELLSDNGQWLIVPFLDLDEKKNKAATFQSAEEALFALQSVTKTTLFAQYTII